MPKYEISFKLNGSVEMEAESVEAVRMKFMHLSTNDTLKHVEGIPVMVGFCILDENRSG